MTKDQIPDSKVCYVKHVNCVTLVAFSEQHYV